MTSADGHQRSKLITVFRDLNRWFFGESLLLWALAESAGENGHPVLSRSLWFVLWISAVGVFLAKCYPLVERIGPLVLLWIIASVIIAYYWFPHGAAMPQLLSGKLRFVLPVLFTLGTLYSWYRAFVPSKPSDTLPQIAPTTTPATTSPSTAPTSQPASAKLSTEHVARRLGDLRDSIQRLHQLKADDGVKQDQLRRIQAQMIDLWFPAVDQGILPQVNPPLARSPNPRDALQDWKRLAERTSHPSVPHPLLLSDGTDGGVYRDPPAGVTAWIDHAVALVSVLQDQAAAGPYPTPPVPLLASSQRCLPPEAQNIVSAVFGEGPPEREDQWIDVTPIVRHLATLDPPVTANLTNLHLSPTFLHGTPKLLRIALRDGRIVTIKEGDQLDLRSSKMLDVPRLTAATATGSREVTEDDPPWVHLIAIKTAAATFRESRFDEIDRIVNSRANVNYAPPAGGVDRAIWIEESKRLDEYHDIRIALIREVEHYLPDVRIPVLRDFTRAWRWGRPLPERSKFIAELEEIEHQANRAARQLAKSEDKPAYDLAAVRSVRDDFDKWATMRHNAELMGSEFGLKSTIKMNDMHLDLREQASPLIGLAESYSVDGAPLRAFCHPASGDGAEVTRGQIRAVLDKLEAAILKEKRSA